MGFIKYCCTYFHHHIPTFNVGLLLIHFALDIHFCHYISSAASPALTLWTTNDWHNRFCRYGRFWNVCSSAAIGSARNAWFATVSPLQSVFWGALHVRRVKSCLHRCLNLSFLLSFLSFFHCTLHRRWDLVLAVRLSAPLGSGGMMMMMRRWRKDQPL